MRFHLVNDFIIFKMVKKIIISLFFLLPLIQVSSQVLPEPPVPPRLVNDLSGILDKQSVDNLERALMGFSNETSTQIAIVTLNDISGYEISDFSFRLAEKWGIGQKDKRNGILILVKPKTSQSKGEAFIAVGYGLEGAVPDVVAKRIVQNEMIPYFRANDYGGGLIAGTNILMEITRGEYTADKYLERSTIAAKPVAIAIVIIFFILMAVVISKGQKVRSSSIGHDLPFWVLLSMLGSSGTRNRSGGWDNFSSGSGSFGGGFGGFGGGSFGGGGAGGSW